MTSLYIFLLVLPSLLLFLSIVRTIRKRRGFYIYEVFEAFFLLYFFIAPFISFSTHYYDNLDNILPDITQCYFTFYATYIGIYIIQKLAFYKKKSLITDEFLNDIVSRIPLTSVKLLWVVMVSIGLFTVFEYGIAIYGSGTYEMNLTIPYFFRIIQLLNNNLLNAFIGIGAVLFLYKKTNKLLHFLMILSSILINYNSRSAYIITFLVFMLVFIIKNHFLIKRKIIFIGVVLFLFMWQIFFPSLLAFRLNSQRFSESYSDADLKSLLTYSIDNTRAADKETLNKENEENLKARDNIVLKNIVHQKYPERFGKYMDGGLLLSQFLYVVPSAFNPTKLEQATSGETFMLKFYGLYVIDIPDNIPLYGYIDFGYWGCMLAGLIMGLVVLICDFWIGSFKKSMPFLAIIILFAILGDNILFEYPYIQLFSTLRNLIILVLIAQTVRLFTLVHRVSIR